MVVHYPRTVWKNSYAEHEVTGKTYNIKKYVSCVNPSLHECEFQVRTVCFAELIVSEAFQYKLRKPFLLFCYHLSGVAFLRYNQFQDCQFLDFSLISDFLRIKKTSIKIDQMWSKHRSNLKSIQRQA